MLFARDPTLAPPPEPAAAADEASAAAPAGFACRAEVDAALASALGYFAASEPTSPALLLIRQARETLGKNLFEVMKLLAPPHAENARVFIGPDGAFTVPVKSLANAPTLDEPRAPSQPAASRAAALALIDAVAQHMRAPSRPPRAAIVLRPGGTGGGAAAPPPPLAGVGGLAAGQRNAAA